MKDQKGQALVETAIVLPLLILLIMGLFEFGRFLYLKNTINNAARAGARAAAVTPKFDAALHPDGMAATGVTHTMSCTDSEYAASNGAVYRSICNSLFNGIPKNEVVVDIVYTDLATPAGLSSGDSVSITLTWDKFEAVLPILIPITNRIKAEASMRYE
ncbi:pilus assembly protein [Geomonas subterranea]|uniref:Pilus assembly protein n=1 Tax=Geomonas subterranea TaxID=2847989 RepID=A0ABX8LNM4_9BACT|nr:TadE/TadG family type IV pilus assembly protein [Geomonas subterranea]QXE92305.1 pilus assembly protein [Geomonas subterranea]QXM09596.1 pilus assembly protein [Geomonas subterranea]